MINDFSYVKSKLLISVIFDNVLYSWWVLVAVVSITKMVAMKPFIFQL